MKDFITGPDQQCCKKKLRAERLGLQKNLRRYVCDRRDIEAGFGNCQCLRSTLLNPKRAVAQIHRWISENILSFFLTLGLRLTKFFFLTRGRIEFTLLAPILWSFPLRDFIRIWLTATSQSSRPLRHRRFPDRTLLSVQGESHLCTTR